MRKFVILLLVALMAVAGSTLADDDPLAGVTIESLGAARPPAAGGQALIFLRITMEPGAVIASHSHPGHVILVVDSGEFTTEFTRGEGSLTRYQLEAEQVSLGAEQVLRAGDSLSYDGSAAHTMANVGEEPLVLLVSALLDPAQDGFLFHHHH